MSRELGSVAAIKIVQEASKYVEGCGPPLRVALIEQPWEISPPVLRLMTPEAAKLITDDRVHVFSPHHIDKLASIIAKAEAATKNTRMRHIRRSLEREAVKAAKSMLPAYPVNYMPSGYAPSSSPSSGAVKRRMRRD
jgi:hypothetical protein